MEEKLNSINILLVEDNEDDIIIFKRAFSRIRLLNNLSIVRDGEEALDYIYHRGKYAEKKPPAPGLILLDISMPKMNGFQVLKKIKEDLKFRRIPVIMQTTSDREADIIKSFEDGACSYITKPVNFNEFLKVIENFELYWTIVSKIP